MRSRTILTGALTLALCLAGTARADEDKGRPKGTKDAKPGVITIDASKLPPDLVKQLLKFTGERKKPNKKGMPSAKGPQAQLPPGLRNKPRNHPGVVAFLARNRPEQPRKPAYEESKKPGKGKGKKGKDD